MIYMYHKTGGSKVLRESTAIFDCIFRLAFGALSLHDVIHPLCTSLPTKHRSTVYAISIYLLVI